MFENVGKTIKSLAKILLVLGIVGWIALAITMFKKSANASNNADYYSPHSSQTYSDAVSGVYRMLGCVFLLVGPVLSFASHVLIYGFGELIETNCEIAYNMRNNTFKKSSCYGDTNTSVSKTDQSHWWLGTCEMCHSPNVRLSRVKTGAGEEMVYKDMCLSCAKKYTCTDDRSENLHELLRMGLITEEEYKAKKGGAET